MNSKNSAAVSVTGQIEPGYESVLTGDALEFVAGITREFRPRVVPLLAAREKRQERIDAGEFPDFLEATRDIRESDWRVTGAAPELRGRRVVFGDPTDRKAIIEALDSADTLFVADFEGSLSPAWGNIVRGQSNLRDAAALGDKTAAPVVCPRAWHRAEKHVLVDDAPATAALVDFGLYLMHNAATLQEQDTGAYFCLPKLESHHEARLWNDLFRHCESRGVVDAGRIRVMVLIETVPAAFEVEEILHELRENCVGMLCDRRDYLFSFVKTFRRYAEFVLPDESEATMRTHFLRAWSRLVADTCRRRGAHAFGETAAAGGVEEPGEDSGVTAADLLQVVKGRITEDGVCRNIRVVVHYLAAWLGGEACVQIDRQTENAAAAELARAQLWQWVHHETGILDEGTNVTLDYVGELLAGELERIRESLGDDAFDRGHYRDASRLLEELVRDETLAPFLSLAACDEPA